MLGNITTLAVKMDDIDAALSKLKILLDIEMGGHTSDAIGDYYCTHIRKRPLIRLVPNLIPDFGSPTWVEKGFKDHPLLIDIEDVETPEQLDAMIDTILSDADLGAVVVDKDFFDDEGNEVDLQGNIIKKAADSSGL